MTVNTPTLHLLCGKVAAGKSTLAERLAAQPGTIRISEDIWLKTLFADQMQTLKDYVRCSAKLRDIVRPHVISVLETGVSVVLDFHANTRDQRRWLKAIAEAASVPHVLHFLDVSDDVCLSRLHARNAAGNHPFAVTDEQFRVVTGHFAAPVADEGFTVRHYLDDGTGEGSEVSCS
ncbi:AAA family ATPase [Epibacterium sp. Ofav1-8]|uniref:AAA family ATPase n=1 Tax=Epibacterium sp. Ofav1-8 TaxID=2917735 RepID=UPI001EF526A2|nr:ATP-binding protein [Epibacterium sp. Ofav1-8]MCG7623524.1 ATP-binding protein [Epibacterium sp. Ofav1-8]